MASLGFSWLLRHDAWWSGVLVNAGTTLVLFAPLLLIGRHIEWRLDEVQTAQRQIGERQDETSSRIETLAEEVAQAQNELRLARQELSDQVAARLASIRASDGEAFAKVGDEPSHEATFNGLVRAAALGLTARDGCRVPIENTNIYLRFETPTASDSFQDGPDPAEELHFRLESTGGVILTYLAWPQSLSAAEFLVNLGQTLQAVGHYPGDERFAGG
ncbi:hypothetical protein [Micromonospora musae]|uniref:hypothetical protein n=1 Tax=Micromonospora musae TaxID=1894970 RepID=UPI0011C3FAAC|nr:hypothetical protein [Micromonospora musae]